MMLTIKASQLVCPGMQIPFRPLQGTLVQMSHSLGPLTEGGLLKPNPAFILKIIDLSLLTFAPPHLNWIVQSQVQVGVRSHFVGGGLAAKKSDKYSTSNQEPRQLLFKVVSSSLKRRGSVINTRFAHSEQTSKKVQVQDVNTRSSDTFCAS